MFIIFIQISLEFFFSSKYSKFVSKRYQEPEYRLAIYSFCILDIYSIISSSAYEIPYLIVFTINHCNYLFICKRKSIIVEVAV